MATSESLEDFLILKRDTGECDEGPEILMRPGLLTVRYDAETEAGQEWTTIRFAGAVAVRVIPEPVVQAMMIRAYSKVAIVNNSAWMASMSGKRGDGELPTDLKHFVIFFDHYGSVETIARSCEVQE